MSIPSWPDAFRAYLRFASEKSRADIHEAYEYSAGAMDVVMDFIADNIEHTLAQDLAYELGQYEVGADED